MEGKTTLINQIKSDAEITATSPFKLDNKYTATASLVPKFPINGDGINVEKR